MKKLILPREKSEYVPSGIYRCTQENRKEAFFKLFSSLDEEDDLVIERRMENLKELRRADS